MRWLLSASRWWSIYGTSARGGRWRWGALVCLRSRRQKAVEVLERLRDLGIRFNKTSLRKLSFGADIAKAAWDEFEEIVGESNEVEIVDEVSDGESEEEVDVISKKYNRNITSHCTLKYCQHCDVLECKHCNLNKCEHCNNCEHCCTDHSQYKSTIYNEKFERLIVNKKDFNYKITTYKEYIKYSDIKQIIVTKSDGTEGYVLFKKNTVYYKLSNDETLKGWLNKYECKEPRLIRLQNIVGSPTQYNHRINFITCVDLIYKDTLVRSYNKSYKEYIPSYHELIIRDTAEGTANFHILNCKKRWYKILSYFFNNIKYNQKIMPYSKKSL